MSKGFLLLALSTLFFLHTQAQQPQTPAGLPVADNRVPCQKNPNLPAFNIRLVDTVSVFNTGTIKQGRRSAFIFFGPECSHCREFFARFFVGIDTLKNIDFYLVTPIRNPVAFTNFYNEFHIGTYKNIKAAGRDLDFFAMDFFGIARFPQLILYDEHKQFVKGLSAEAAFSEIHN